MLSANGASAPNSSVSTVTLNLDLNAARLPNRKRARVRFRTGTMRATMLHGLADGPLMPDQEEAQRFLNLLDGTATGWVFQTFDDSDEKRPALIRTLHGSLGARWAKLEELNAAGAGVFVTINEIEPGRPRDTKNVRRVRALFIDLDDPLRFVAVWSKILEYGVLPSIVTCTSEGKHHFYWLVNDCPLDLFKPAQQRLIELFETDRSVCDLPRVMRLPGFIHRKGTPFRSRLVGVT